MGVRVCVCVGRGKGAGRGQPISKMPCEDLRTKYERSGQEVAREETRSIPHMDLHKPFDKYPWDLRKPCTDGGHRAAAAGRCTEGLAAWVESHGGVCFLEFRDDNRSNTTPGDPATRSSSSSSSSASSSASSDASSNNMLAVASRDICTGQLVALIPASLILRSRFPGGLAEKLASHLTRQWPKQYWNPNKGRDDEEEKVGDHGTKGKKGNAGKECKDGKNGNERLEGKEGQNGQDDGTQGGKVKGGARCSSPPKTATDDVHHHPPSATPCRCIPTARLTPYFRSLPSTFGDDHPVCWGTERWDTADHSQLPAGVQSVVGDMRRRIEESATRHDTDDHRYARLVCLSRSFGTIALRERADVTSLSPGESNAEVALVPAADMIQHSEDPNTEWVFKPDGSFHLEATCFISKGGEVTGGYAGGGDSSLTRTREFVTVLAAAGVSEKKRLVKDLCLFRNYGIRTLSTGLPPPVTESSRAGGSSRIGNKRPRPPHSAPSAILVPGASTGGSQRSCISFVRSTAASLPPTPSALSLSNE